MGFGGPFGEDFGDDPPQEPVAYFFENNDTLVGVAAGDDVVRAVNSVRTQNDSLTNVATGDNATRDVDSERIQNDTLVNTATGDSATRAVNSERIQDDTLVNTASGDGVQRERALSRSKTEIPTLTATDGVTRLLEYTRSRQDTLINVATGDNATRAVDSERLQGEGVTPSDRLSINMLTKNEGVIAVDDAFRAVDSERAKIEIPAPTATDTVIKEHDAHRHKDDGANVTTGVVEEDAYERAQDDATAAVTDTITKEHAAQRAKNDTLTGVVDDAFRAVDSHRLQDDTVVHIVTEVKLFGWGRSQDDGVTPTDGVTKEHNAHRLKGDSVASVDSGFRSVDSQRFQADTSLVSDITVEEDAHHRIQNDVVIAADTKSKVYHAHRLKSDTVSHIESYNINNLTHKEYLTVADSTTVLHLIVGHSDTGIGWVPVQQEVIVQEDLAAGENLTFVVEDYVEQATVSQPKLRLYNTEGKTVHALVTFYVRHGTYNNTESVVLLNENIVGANYIELSLDQLVPNPFIGNRLNRTRKTWHRVVITSQETTDDAQVIALIKGLTAKTTKLSAEKPRGSISKGRTIYGF